MKLQFHVPAFVLVFLCLCNTCFSAEEPALTVYHPVTCSFGQYFCASSLDRIVLPSTLGEIDLDSSADNTAEDVLTEPDLAEKLKNSKSSRFGWADDPKRFFTGAFLGFLGHETGHVLANYAVGTDPYLKSVKYGPFPFFTIEPGKELTDREHYLISSAGFNAQHLINEWMLTSHPNLREEDEPLLKGIATFNFWLTVGYAASAFTKTGPVERDTKGMADSLGWSERSVGAMILVPTLLDTYRYKHPEAKWAKTASRISKIVIIGLVFTVDD